MIRFWKIKIKKIKILLNKIFLIILAIFYQKQINSFMTEAVCFANQWTGSYMITASVMKGLIIPIT